MDTVGLIKSNFEEVLSRAEKILRSGGIIIAPTDTVYGIIGRADEEAVIKKIFALKKRPQEKAFPVFVKDIAEARRYAYISDTKAKFLEKIWPGPVTAVFHHKEKLPMLLTGGKDTIGIRVPNHPFLLKLLARVEFPLVQTSANISNQPPAKNLEEIQGYFKKGPKEPELVIDGGVLAGGQSTMISLTGVNPVILRTGAVTKEELNHLFRFMDNK